MQVQQQPTNQDNAIDLMINMGPQHPSTHGVFRLVIWVDGERIVKAEPHIGYLHRGSEKLCEDELYSQVITLFDRLDYVANLNCELAFCMAVEKLMEIEVPERAQYIRTIFCELNRIASHMLFYGVYGMDAGAVTPILYGFRERERIQSLFESVTGARMMHNYFRVGGVNEELPDDFDQRLSKLTDELKQGIDECDDLLSQNEMFLARTKGIGTISGLDAIAFGVTGPALRASGVLEDVRISEPYGIYDRFDYGIPVGNQGDCWDRYYVRVEEMRQSLSIIDQAVNQMEAGEIQANVRRIARPPKGEVYIRTESPRGDFGVFLVSDGTDKPYRVKVRAPSFCNLQSLQHMLREAYIADAVIILGSTDIVLGEVDR
ncbi:MAG: NADH-quinone oxidoreductase subunit D [Dehalococcoidia bacterium]|nr:NADH-quinone oxidoreductase subunit D [Dehalococcoidia bacterium]|tara:strand:- start:12 stop:1136 length:1125 start_codon:yes stop_codon:yes gene_type:complete